MDYYSQVEQGTYSPQVKRLMFDITLVISLVISIMYEWTGYARATNILWEMALKSGDYPIFGICLGMQIMATISNNNGRM